MSRTHAQPVARRRARLASLAVLGALGLGSCADTSSTAGAPATSAAEATDSADTATDDPVSSPGTSATPGGSATPQPQGAVPRPGVLFGTDDGASAADPEHAVDPPGPRRPDQAIMPPDMLIYNAEEPLSDSVVEAVESLDGVTDVTRMSMAQVSLENRVYTVGVVDPATYRLFTPVESATFQQTWDRVAGGEVAVAPAQRRRLPIDADGYLSLSVGGATERIHVGAYAPQVDGVDVVVNSAWGEDLDVPAGNALLLRTGTTAPQALRPSISRIVGDQAAITDLDAVARTGIDPEATLTAYPVGGAAGAVGVFRYTAIGGGRIAPEPSWVASHISTETVPILGSVTCNRAIMPQLRAALGEVVARGLADEINAGEYAGCYYPRFIAGTTTLSNHSFGTALDLNTPGNQRGTVGEIDRDVVSIFKKWGFAWGGDWRFTDPMHFEAVRIVDPR